MFQGIVRTQSVFHKVIEHDVAPVVVRIGRKLEDLLAHRGGARETAHNADSFNPVSDARTRRSNQGHGTAYGRAKETQSTIGAEFTLPCQVQNELLDLVDSRWLYEQLFQCRNVRHKHIEANSRERLGDVFQTRVECASRINAVDDNQRTTRAFQAPEPSDEAIQLELRLHDLRKAPEREACKQFCG